MNNYKLISFLVLLSTSVVFAQEKSVEENSVSILEENQATILSAYPNPFHSEITFVVPQLNHERSVTIDIYNLSGQKVVTLSNDFNGSHRNEIIWRPRNVEPGIYMVFIDKSVKKEVLKLIYEP